MTEAWRLSSGVIFFFFAKHSYGLRRVSFNESIVLDAGEATIDPLASKMVNAGSQEEEKDPLDKIVKEFNEHWFKGWDATPDAQKAKFLVIARAVAADADYQKLVVGNPNEQAVDEVMATIIKRAVLRQRKADQALYNQYRDNGEFKAGFNAVIRRIIATPEIIGDWMQFGRKDYEDDYAMAAERDHSVG